VDLAHRELRPQDHREEQTFSGGGGPAAPEPAAAGALSLRDHDGALRGSLEGKGLRLDARRLDLVVVPERVTEHAALGALGDVAHGEARRLILQPVAAAGDADNAVAALAQRLHVLMDGVTRDAQDVADGLAGHEVVVVPQDVDDRLLALAHPGGLDVGD